MRTDSKSDSLKYRTQEISNTKPGIKLFVPLGREEGEAHSHHGVLIIETSAQNELLGQ